MRSRLIPMIPPRQHRRRVIDVDARDFVADDLDVRAHGFVGMNLAPLR